MSHSSILNLLQRVSIFNGIPQELLLSLAERLQLEQSDSGNTIINKGDEGNSMFVIAEGRVKIHDGEHVVAILEAGNFFGEFSLLDEAPRSMSVTALENISVIKISRVLFFELLQSQPEVAKK